MRRNMVEERKTAIARVQTARHPERPYTLDLLSAIFTEFVEFMETGACRRCGV
jgi:acetyl-CoA carboxylase alpha subunit